MRNVGYYNGKIGLMEEMSVPFLDRALFFGDGVYDATYAANRRIFETDFHVDRFYNSLKAVRIDFPYSKPELIAELQKCIDAMDSDGVVFVYWQATRGTAPRNHVFPENTPPNFLIYVVESSLTDLRIPKKAITVEDTRFLHCNIKTLNLLPTVMARQEAEEAGVDGLLIVTPYYNKATQPGLIKHYSEIARSVKTPIIMYNVPGRTGCNLLPETVAELFKNEENIVGLKEATGNMAQASKTMYLTDGKLDMYSGEDGLVLPLMSIGAIGVISVWSNIAPAKVHALCESYFKGDLATAQKLQREALPLVDALFSEVNPIPVKTAMNLMGLEVGPLRAPMCEMEAEHAKKLAKVMKEYGTLLA